MVHCVFAGGMYGILCISTTHAVEQRIRTGLVMHVTHSCTHSLTHSHTGSIICCSVYLPVFNKHVIIKSLWTISSSYPHELSHAHVVFVNACAPSYLYLTTPC